MNVVKSLVAFAWDLLYFLTGEGGWRFRPQERVVLEAVSRVLLEAGRNSLLSQIEKTVFVQRSHNRISRPRFYDAPYVRDLGKVVRGVLPVEVFDIEMRVEGKTEIVQVEFYRGMIDSIQFGHASSYYHGKSLQVIDVSTGDAARSQAVEIDRAEHED